MTYLVKTSSLNQFRQCAQQIQGWTVAPANRADVLRAYNEAKVKCEQLEPKQLEECKKILGVDIAGEIKKTDQLVKTKLEELDKPRTYFSILASYIPTWASQSEPVGALSVLDKMQQDLEFASGVSQRSLGFISDLKAQMTKSKGALLKKFEEDKLRIENQPKTENHLVKVEKQLRELKETYDGEVKKLDDRLVQEKTKFEKAFEQLENQFEEKKKLCQACCEDDAVKQKALGDDKSIRRPSVSDVLGDDKSMKRMMELTINFRQIANEFKSRMNDVKLQETTGLDLSSIQFIITSLIPKIENFKQEANKPAEDQPKKVVPLTKREATFQEVNEVFSEFIPEDTKAVKKDAATPVNTLPENLYSRPGDKAAIDGMVEALKKNKRALVSDRIEEMTGLLMALLSSLKNPLLKVQKDAFYTAGSIAMDGRKASLIQAINTLPQESKALLKTVILHLSRIANNPNQLDSHDLAERFVPVLFESEDSFEKSGALMTEKGVDLLARAKLTLSLAYLIDYPDLLGA